MNTRLFKALMTAIAFGSPLEGPVMEIEKQAKKKIKNPATEKEMTEHCKKYPCGECPIAYKCNMFLNFFGHNNNGG